MAFTDIVFTSGRARFIEEIPAGAAPGSAVAPGVNLLDAVTALYNGTRPEMSGSPSIALRDYVLQYLDVLVSSRLVSGSVSLTAAERNAVADALLARNLAGGSSSGRLVQDALRVLRNKTALVGSTLTVYAEDDTTPAWTATIATGARDPLSSIDPA